MMRSRTWLLVTVSLLAVLGIGLWWTSGGEKEEVKEKVLPQVEALSEVETFQEPQREATKKVVPKEPAKEPAIVTEVIILDEPAEVEEEIVEEPSQGLVTIRGQIDHMDPCTQSITVDGTTVDISRGNFPMYRTYQTGDFVQVTYREKRSGNLLESIELLQER